MQLNHQHRKTVTSLYCLFFYALMLYKWYNGLLLYQVKPFLYNNRYDVVTWVFMNSGLHRWLLNNSIGCIIMDIAFYSLPAIYFIVFIKNVKASAFVAFIMLVVNWTYVQVFTLYPTNSIEGHTAWLLFPILFLCINLKDFYFLLHGLRYFFLYFFASAGLWKIAEYGVFSANQMSGILLYQHAEYLTSSPTSAYTHFIYYLIDHRFLGYSIYVSALLLELAFIIGFFTRKYDRLLIACFLLFLVADIVVMRIHYWEVTPFLITLLFSKYTFPARETTTS